MHTTSSLRFATTLPEARRLHHRVQAAWAGGLPAWWTPTPRRIELAAGQLWVARAGAGRRLKVLAGQVWLTQQGAPQDWALQAGEGLLLQRRGRVIASAEGHEPVVMELT